MLRGPQWRLGLSDNGELRGYSQKSVPSSHTKLTLREQKDRLDRW